MTMDDHLSTLIHPLTGEPLRPVGIVNGRPVWPILGGSEPGGDGGGGEGGDAGDSGDGGGDGRGAPGQGFGQSVYTPPASQAELDRIVQDRLSRVQKQYGMTAEEARAFRERAEALDFELSSDMDKATQRAADDAFSAAMSQAVPRLVRAEFRAEARAVGVTNEQLAALLEDVDLTRYVDDDGEPDLKRIEAKLKAIAPAQPQREFPDLGGGRRGTAPKPKSMSDLIRRQAGVNTGTG